MDSVHFTTALHRRERRGLGFDRLALVLMYANALRPSPAWPYRAGRGRVAA